MSTLFFAYPPTPSMNIFIFGLGYVGFPLACELQKRGFKVSGATRTQKRATELQQAGVQTFAVEQDPSPDFLHQVLNAHHILSSVGPDDGVDPVLRQFGNTILQGKALRLNYLSSTGVYGDRDGEIVNEQSVPRNVGELGKRRLEIEGQWTEFANKLDAKLSVFRLAGIYGPHRSSLHTLYKIPDILTRFSQTADMLISRIHVDDIIAALVAAIEHGHYLDAPNPIVFNVCDDKPSSMREVFGYSKELLEGLGVNMEARATLTEFESRFFASNRERQRGNKQVSNAKMKQFLVPELKYPTYREGLAAVAKDMFSDGLVLK